MRVDIKHTVFCHTSYRGDHGGEMRYNALHRIIDSDPTLAGSRWNVYRTGSCTSCCNANAGFATRFVVRWRREATTRTRQRGTARRNPRLPRRSRKRVGKKRTGRTSDDDDATADCYNIIVRSDDVRALEMRTRARPPVSCAVRSRPTPRKSDRCQRVIYTGADGPFWQTRAAALRLEIADF